VVKKVIDEEAAYSKISAKATSETNSIYAINIQHRNIKDA